jgi:uncharacterized protein
MQTSVGQYATLKILRRVEFGVYLDYGAEGVLLPKRFVPSNLKEGDEVKVFLYHDSDGRIIATTETPKAVVGEIALLKVVSVTKLGAFLDWGLMKDLFVPKSKQLSQMYPGESYLVKLFIDEMTGRIAATEKFDSTLSNETLTVKELDVVQLIAYRRTDIGWLMIINNQHTGVLHSNEVYKVIRVGDKFEGFGKHIYPDNRIDVAAGQPGYQRVSGESQKILNMLKDNGGYLPYNDKSSPEDIYEFFGMSKKTFKMAVGNLYKERKIEITNGGLKLGAGAG